MVLPLAWLSAIAASAQEDADARPPSTSDLDLSQSLAILEPASLPLRPEYPDETELLVQEDPSWIKHRSGCDSCGHDGCRSKTFGGRLYWALSEALCVCDECYQPRWHLIESASFWVDSARTQNRVRLRWDYGAGMIFPDRAEYFWARVGGKGPDAQPGSNTVDELNYHEMSIYTETAQGKFSVFTVTPYRSLYMNEAGHAAGFSDIQIGTKSMLHDTPLLQVSLQMTTTIPSANPKEGLGVGHVALEPALLFGLSLTHRDFMQAQIAEWIPLGGDSSYAGALLRWGVSWNRVMWELDHDNVLTTNLDFVGWSFQDGAYTDPIVGQRSANNETYFYLGPGARFLLCGKYEFGMGGLFALSRNHFAEQILRTDFTIRY